MIMRARVHINMVAAAGKRNERRAMTNAKRMLRPADQSSAISPPPTTTGTETGRQAQKSARR